MFEPQIEKDTEQIRSRAIIWVGAAVVIILTVIIMMLASSKPSSRQELENVVRAGSPVFDGYKDKVELEVVDKITHPNMIGMFQLEVKAKLHNRGDRTLTGVEVIGKMLDMNDKVIAQDVSIPIPRARTKPLAPGESMPFSVKVDAPGKITEAEVKDIIIELRGLRFE